MTTRRDDQKKESTNETITLAPEYIKHCTIERYKRDSTIRYHTGLGGHEQNDRGKSEVTEYSYKSRKRLAFVVNNTSVPLDRMITLTYPEEFPKSGKVAKAHLNRFLKWMREQYPNDIVDYLWVMEFQERGAPHFHILCNKWFDYDRIAEVWYRIVDSGDKNHLFAGTQIKEARKINGLKHYMVQYAYKYMQKIVPADFVHVGRFWGHSKGVKPKPIKVIEEATLEQALQESEKHPKANAIMKSWMNGERGLPLSTIFKPAEKVDKGTENT